MKAIIWSDLHAHQHKKSQARLEDCIEVLEWVFLTAKKQNIDVILFCGDLFHDRAKIDILTYQRVFETFQEHMAGPSRPNVYLLLGNHDLFFFEKKNISSVYPLSSIDGITIISKPSVVDIQGHQVGFLPYTHDPIADLDKVRIKSKKKVLCGHIAVHGALFNLVYGTTSDVQIEGDSGMLLVTPDIFNEYDRVFLGHYHAAQELNDKVEYVGSPLQLSFGEMSQDKHIVVYDFDTDERTYIKNTFSNTHRRFKSTKEAQMTALVENLEGEFIEIYDENTSSVETLELKQLLSTQKLGSLSIKQLPKKIEKEALEIKDAKSILSSTDQMLDSYLKSILNLTLDIEELSKIGKQICETKTEE